MIVQHTRWLFLCLMITFSLLGLSGWFADSVYAIEVEIKLAIRDSQYIMTEWVPPPEGAFLVITIKNEDAIRHGFISELFHNHLIRTNASGVQVYGKGIEGLYLDPGKTIQLRFQVDRPGDYPFQCDLHPHMKGELLLLHVDAV
jgi:hypothetical protein